MDITLSAPDSLKPPGDPQNLAVTAFLALVRILSRPWGRSVDRFGCQHRGQKW